MGLYKQPPFLLEGSGNMSEKHDRGYARTAQDIENKYAFGKTFADMLRLINENRDKVNSAESSLRDEISKTSTELRRNTEEVVVQAKKEIMDGAIANLQSQVEMKLDTSQVSIEVQKQLENGVDKVITKTGYVFDDEGMNISKSDSAIKNKIDNTGVYVTKNSGEVLTANHEGVNATDLHAKTYLIIGEDDGRSRFEDYQTNRTGCFWIGG